MSKHDDLTTEELNEELALLDESFEPSIEQGPTPVMVTSGKLDKALHPYTHCNACGGRLHFNYISDFSRNTTHEKSSCPECQLGSRQVLHRLQ
jgi:hypothetical protein